MFKCYRCSREASHFCENSEVLLCSDHISTHLNDGCKENILCFDSPIIEEYSECISNRLQSDFNQVKNHMKTIINLLSNLHKQISNIEKIALRSLFTLRKNFSNQIKKLKERTLTMNEAKIIFEKNLNFQSENFDKNSKIILKCFLKMLSNTADELLIIKNNNEPRVKNEENKGETKFTASTRKTLNKRSNSDKKIKIKLSGPTEKKDAFSFLNKNLFDPSNKNVETKFIEDNPTSTTVLNNENQIKKVKSEEIYKIWECKCDALNFDGWEICNQCKRVKPGLRGWVCPHCNFRNKSQNIVQCEGCRNYKDLKNCDAKNYPGKNPCDQLILPCKKKEKTDFSSNFLDNSPKVIKTERINEGMYLNSYSTGISIDKTFFKTTFQDSSHIVVRDTPISYMKEPGILICSDCHKDRKECMGQSPILENNSVANIEGMKSSNKFINSAKNNFNESIKLNIISNQISKPDIEVSGASKNIDVNKQAMRSKSLPKKPKY